MPLIRKVHDMSGSKLVALPREWFEYFEKVKKVRVREVAIEVNEDIIIKPIFEPMPENLTEKVEVKAKR